MNDGWYPPHWKVAGSSCSTSPPPASATIAYFAAIEHELASGGYEALLHELLSRDIADVNLRRIPVTDALITQRKLSLDTTEAWWVDCLHKGYVFTSEIGLEDDFHEWLDPISTELLFKSYEKFCRAHNERHPLSRELLGRWLRATAGGKHPAGALDGRRTHRRRHHLRQQLLQPRRRTRLEGPGVRLSGRQPGRRTGGVPQGHRPDRGMGRGGPIVNWTNPSGAGLG